MPMRVHSVRKCTCINVLIGEAKTKRNGGKAKLHRTMVSTLTRAQHRMPCRRLTSIIKVFLLKEARPHPTLRASKRQIARKTSIGSTQPGNSRFVLLQQDCCSARVKFDIFHHLERPESSA